MPDAEELDCAPSKLCTLYKAQNAQLDSIRVAQLIRTPHGLLKMSRVENENSIIFLYHIIIFFQS